MYEVNLNNIDKEIESLIERAGSPIVIVHGDHHGEETPEQRNASQIDRLMITLHNVIIERDQLYKDLVNAYLNDEPNLCDVCAHRAVGSNEEPCSRCLGCEDPLGMFEYRGVSEE